MSVTECCAVIPVPDNAICNVEFEALLTTESLPLTTPAAAGLKFTETVTDCVGVKIALAGLLALNPLPVADTLEIVTLVFPLFVRVTNCAVDVPTVTLLKFTLVELGES